MYTAPMNRIAIDTGGTFTDAVLLDEDGVLRLGKGLTRPDRSWLGIEEALTVVADQVDSDVPTLLADCDLFLYGTTRSTNAILTERTARTALLTTEGFPDVLTLREGGRLEPFNLAIEYPRPYVERRDTYEVPERIDAEGGVVTALDRDAVKAMLGQLADDGVEAIGVCLLWSILNPSHELAIGELLDELAPDLPYTLSHQINPIMREYRRASSTVIDASLKPLMDEHFAALERDLRDAGLAGDLLAFTSLGGVMHIDDIRSRPVLTVKSGPSMAPVAAHAQAEVEGFGDEDVVVCDTGGTSFDVGLVPAGEVKFTRDTVLGKEFTGYTTGLSSVDIRSIGSGGGSIAWVDAGGLLRVGPQSAGADPGPACYGRGGVEPTMTDAAVLLGYLDADYFAGGRMQLDLDAAKSAFEGLADRLSMSTEEAAHGVLTVATEDMIGAIRDITINQGVDPRESTIVAGGGAAGINVVAIARELGVRRVLVPHTAGTLSASGGQHADILHEISVTRLMDTGAFDFDAANAALDEITAGLHAYADRLRARGTEAFRLTYSVEARYAFQVWELEVPLAGGRVESAADVAALASAFHDVHERTFAIKEPSQDVECVNWKGRLTAELEKPVVRREEEGPSEPPPPHRHGEAFFPSTGVTAIPRYHGEDLRPGCLVEGPAAIDQPTTTLIVYPGSRARMTPSRNFLVDVD